MTLKQEEEQQAVLSGAYYEHSKGLNSYAFFKVSDHMVGEDLVQDTFIKTWNYLLKGA
jgi:DNA-directed RNA polymerase specialized sigma24 family protein